MVALAALLLAPAVAGTTPTCKGGTKKLTAQSGSFTDGSAEKAQYANNQDLCWVIAPSCPKGSRVELWFKRVDIEAEYDFLQVYGAKGTVLTDAASPEVSLTDSGFTVWFRTDYSVTATGFHAEYACSSLSEEPEETIDLEAVESVERSEEETESVVRRGVPSGLTVDE